MGEPGRSLKVWVHEGRWKDFATDEHGDLIALYAANQGVSQLQAARELAGKYGFKGSVEPAPDRPPRMAPPPPRPTYDIGPPPDDAPEPSLLHPVLGSPTLIHTYRDQAGRLLNFVCRYQDGPSKQFVPWSWDRLTSRWVMKSLPEPRPLYGLHELRSDGRVLVVEGEKAADAARGLAGHVYSVLAWPNGGSAWDRADWSPVFGREVLLWPDSDRHTHPDGRLRERQPGLAAMLGLAEHLTREGCRVKYIDTTDPGLYTQDGFDAADAVKLGWDYQAFLAWARPRAVAFELPAAEPEVLPPETEPAPAPAAEPDTSEDPDQQDEDPRPDPPPAEEPPRPSQVMMIEQYGLTTNKQGVPDHNAANLLRVFSAFPGIADHVWFDSFYQVVFTDWGIQGVGPAGPREWSDADEIRLMVELQDTFGFRRLTRNVVSDAVHLFARSRPRHEPRDWIESLTWDGTPRVLDFFARAMGAAETHYSQAVSKNWWVSIVARVMKPGCKVDTMVILEGLQGSYKSTAMQIVGGKWYGEVTESPTNKDFFQALHGKVIAEIAELDSFSRAETTTIKRVLSTAIDRFRPPYGRHAQDFPRQCVFVGTTNEKNYLKDHTGARRFWPVKVHKIDLDYIRENRDQLFAEAVVMFREGATWWAMPTDETNVQQADRYDADVWEDIIAGYLALNYQVTVAGVATGPLEIDPGRISKLDQMRIAKILERLGWHREQAWDAESKRNVRVWKRPVEKN